MEKFTICRSKWLRGKRNGLGEVAPPMLLDHDDQKCCLGFYLESCGVTTRTMISENMPSDISFSVPEKADWLLEYDEDKNETWETLLQSVNDDEGLLDPDREKSIREHFLDNDIEVEFVD